MNRVELPLRHSRSGSYPAIDLGSLKWFLSNCKTLVLSFKEQLQFMAKMVLFVSCYQTCMAQCRVTG